MSLKVQKFALAALAVLGGVLLSPGCVSTSPVHSPPPQDSGTEGYTEEISISGTPSRSRPPPRPPPKRETSSEFSRVPVVNGKPFADMYFKHYGVNPTIDTEEENISTFSVDVDTASYSLARAYLSRNVMPAEEAIRVEEFVNAFRYGYRDPGEEAFGVQVEAFPSPNRRGYHLLHVGLQGQKVSAAQRLPAHLVFTIDVSGSMDLENRLGLVKRSLAMLVNQLDSRDTLAIVVYGSTARTVLEPTRIQDRSRIREAIDALHPEGSTHVQAGLEVAYAIAASQVREGAISRIILCSDGVANNGLTQADALFQSVKEYARKGVRLTTVGFGMGNYNDELMERLSQVGDGQYAYVDALPEARRLFVEQFTGTLQLIARDVKVQVEFDPSRVARYRLIGFENRMLQKEDFANDRVDAGDIGAGHTVTALYEVKFHEGQAQGPSPFATLRLRYKAPSTRLEEGTSREITEPLPPSLVRPSLEAASGPAQLSAVVALFAEKLRGSYWVRNLSYPQLMRLWQQLPEPVRARGEVSELRQLIQQARALDGRLDKFEKDAPVATMDFDHVPVVR
jgi:Ca-activated chloride channel homolog